MKQRARRSLGRLMTVVGTIGILLSIIAGVIGYQLVGRVNTSLDDSLSVTTEALAAVDNSITVSQQVVGTITTSLDAIATMISTIQTSLTTSSATLDTLHLFLDDSLPKTIDAIAQVLPTIENVAGSVDRALRELSKVPFGPNYNPTVPFDQTIRQLSDAITPLPTNLKTLASNVDSLAGSVTALNTNLTQITTIVTNLHANVTAVRQTLNQYVRTTDSAHRVAATTRAKLRTDATLARLLVIVIVTLFAFSQLATLQVGQLHTREGANPPLDP